MNAFRAVLSLPVFASLAGVVAVIAVVWYIGPLIEISGYAPLASERNRMIAAIILIALWLLWQLFKILRTWHKNRKMAQDLAASEEPDAVAAQTEEELAGLSKVFDQALEELKKAKLDKNLYQLPWYIIIGPPGCGKTTALINSGLNFPLAKRLGTDKIQGVGGTRNCDWWFTDQAVLLDTAGRYVTQDSHETIDSAAWMKFLALLKKYRKRRPINGALIAISLSDLMQSGEAERTAHAVTIRKRIQELHEQLGIRFPVYVLFTKCDLIAGSMEFFDDLGREERGQVWGITFPLDDLSDNSQPAVDDFEEEFNRLEERLNTRLMKRLQDERDSQRRDLIYTFPQQFNSLRGIAKQFLDEVFQPNRFEQRTLLRGVYFTSGTQEGNPIDRLMGALAGTFGIARQTLPSFSGSGRSYFLTRLFNDVVFQEAGLAGTNRRQEQRLRWIQRGAYIGVVVIALLCTAGWYTSYARNKSHVEELETRLAVLTQEIDRINEDVQSDSSGHRSIAAILPLLNDARNIPGADGSENEVGWLSRLGLYQGGKLNPSAISAYHHVLERGLLPRMMLALEEQLRRASNDRDGLYNTLKIYLMLDRSDPERPFEAAEISDYFARIWAADADLQEAQKTQLSVHLSALLERLPNPPSIAPDGPLIEQTRERLASLPPADRIYSQLKQDGLGVAPFRLSDAGGPNVPLVFERASGAALNSGVSAIFTKEGYNQFAEQSGPLVQSMAAQGWVLGAKKIPQSELNKLALEIQRRHREDYCPAWRNFLDDITIISPDNLQQARETLVILAAPDSPLRGLVSSLAAEADDVAAAERCLKEIALLAKSAEENAPTALDQTLSEIDEIAVLLAPLVKAESRGEAIDKTTGNDIVSGLERIADRQPSPVNQWFRTLADEISRHVIGGIRAHLDSIWKRDVLPYCEEAISGRFPLNENSTQEISLANFARFFGPGGIVDVFLNGDIRTFLDTSTRPWSWRSYDNTSGIPPRKLALLQFANDIKLAFFAQGGNQPKLSFQLKPLSMDTESSRFVLNLDGQLISHSHDSLANTTTAQWPGPDNKGYIRLQFFPAAAQNAPASIEYSGSWAWFRALNKANVRSTGRSDVFDLTFRVGEHSARYELRTTTLLNPFRLDLGRFNCPLSL